MITRLRPAWTTEELAGIYAAPHDHRIYGRGHGERVDATIQAGAELIAKVGTDRLWRGADLSCGNAAILTALDLPVTILGDYAPGYQYQGPIEETIQQIPEVDLFVCSETIEHVDDPQLVLDDIRSVAQYLLLSTPVGCHNDSNAEHYWAWDREDVERLLIDSGWSPLSYRNVDSTAYGEPYNYGIWVCT